MAQPDQGWQQIRCAAGLVDSIAVDSIACAILPNHRNLARRPPRAAIASTRLTTFGSLVKQGA